MGEVGQPTNFEARIINPKTSGIKNHRVLIGSPEEHKWGGEAIGQGKLKLSAPMGIPRGRLGS